MKLYKAMYSAFNAMEACSKNGNDEWYSKHNANLVKLCQGLPHGAGIDSTNPEHLHGFDLNKSNGSKLVINCSFHHMNESGYYDGWTDHVITIRPGFLCLDIHVSGRNRNDIKGYLYDCYYSALMEEIQVF